MTLVVFPQNLPNFEVTIDLLADVKPIPPFDFFLNMGWFFRTKLYLFSNVEYMWKRFKTCAIHISFFI